jgi:hypothetical protein
MTRRSDLYVIVFHDPDSDSWYDENGHQWQRDGLERMVRVEGGDGLVEGDDE